MRRIDLRPRRAFSLIDVLVTVGGLALIAAIVLPAVSQAREQARALECAANVGQICTALQGYAATHNGSFPLNVQDPAPGRFWYDRQRVGAILGDRGEPSPSKVGGLALACPSDDGGRRSYAMNVWASGAVDKSVLATTPRGRLWGLEVRDADRMILVVEAWSCIGSAEFGWFAQPWVGLGPELAGRRFGGNGGLTPTLAGRFGVVNCEIDFARHRRPSDGGAGTEPLGRAHFGYADGHVAMKRHGDLVDASGTSTRDSQWHLAEQP